MRIHLPGRRVLLERVPPAVVEPKARLGAKPQEMQVWLRHRQPVFNRIVRQLVGLAHHAEAPETNPFKKG